MNWFRKIFSNIFKRKDSLRDKCVAAYGEEFGEMYDAINRGETIGGFFETVAFIDMLEAVKKGKPIDLNNSDENKKSEIKVTGAFIPGQNGEPDVNITIDENGKVTKTFI